MACAFEQYCEVYLNGTSLGSSKSGGTTTFTWFQTTVFVAKGDVVRITTSDNGGNSQITGVVFVPIHEPRTESATMPIRREMLFPIGHRCSQYSAV